MIRRFSVAVLLTASLGVSIHAELRSNNTPTPTAPTAATEVANSNTTTTPTPHVSATEIPAPSAPADPASRSIVVPLIASVQGLEAGQRIDLWGSTSSSNTVELIAENAAIINVSDTQTIEVRIQPNDVAAVMNAIGLAPFSVAVR